MSAGLVVDTHPVGPRIGKRLDEVVWIVDHHVAVDRQLRHLAQRFQHRRPDRQVGHKMPIHHIEVYDGTAARLGSLDLIGQMREVR